MTLILAAALSASDTHAISFQGVSSPLAPTGKLFLTRWKKKVGPSCSSALYLASSLPLLQLHQFTVQSCIILPLPNPVFPLIIEVTTLIAQFQKQLWELLVTNFTLPVLWSRYLA